MMNDLITTDLIVQENVKDYFNLFYLEIPIGGKLYGFLKQYDFYSKKQIYIKDERSLYYQQFLKPKFNFLLHEQAQKINKNNLTLNEIYFYILDKIKNRKIPLRYLPEKKEIKKIYKRKSRLFHLSDNLEGVKETLKFYQLTFKTPLISLIEQKFKDKESIKIVAFFKSLNEHNGLEFDKYIENWSKRLLK